MTPKADLEAAEIQLCHGVDTWQTQSRAVGSVEVKSEISEEMEAKVLGVYEVLPASNQQLQRRQQKMWCSLLS